MRASDQCAVELALSLGFSNAVLLPLESVAAYGRAHPARDFSLDLPKMMPEAKSVLVAATAYPGFLSWPDGCGEVSAFYFASQKAYAALRALQGELIHRGVRADRRHKLPAKHLGMLSGLGVIGKNTLLRNAKWGSRFSLHTLMTDINAKRPETMMDAQPCGSCARCVSECPTGALSITEGFQRERCLRFHMMSGMVPAPYRKAMQNKFLGCEICQRVCPRQPEKEILPAERPEDFALEKLLLGNPNDLRAIGHRIGKNEARLYRVQAQAALLAGNSGNPAYLPILQKMTTSANEAVSEHANWAIGEIRRCAQPHRKEGANRC